MRALALAALCVCGTAPMASAQEIDTLVVEVRLAGIGAVVVVAEQSRETGELMLPAAPVYRLGAVAEPPPIPYMTVGELMDALRVDIVWLPRDLQLVIRDRWHQLPASRARLDALRAEAELRSTQPLGAYQSGFFGSVTVDERQEALGDIGYTAGRVYGRVAQSTVSGASWSAGVSPVDAVWLTYAQSERSDARLGARLALRRSWLAADYSADRLHVDGVTAWGPLVVYASSRDVFAVTWRSDVDIQVAHARQRSSLRVSFGPADPSPLAIPLVY